jgi:hypothetical protein
VKSGQYINTARADPNNLYAEGGRLKNVDSKNLSVGIMTGTTTESFILTGVDGGPRHNPWTEHRVTIAPFMQDMRRDVSAWGLALNFHIIGGLASTLGFSFTTRAEGRGDNGQYGKLTPSFTQEHLTCVSRWHYWIKQQHSS